MATGSPASLITERAARPQPNPFLHAPIRASLPRMKHYPPPPPRMPKPRRRIPAFHPVPLAPRADGWTVERQAQFIAALALTRSVAKACRMVSMGRESAYRLRKREGAAGFAAAWDASLGKPHTPVELRSAKSTGLTAGYRRLAGRIQVIMQDGQPIAIRRIPDDSALLQHLAQLDRSCADVDRREEKSHFSDGEGA